MRQGLTIAGALLLAGCGGAGGSAGSWNALDACAAVDKAKIGAAAGSTVTRSDLQVISEGSDVAAKVSMCDHKLADGSSISVLTRAAPNADFSAESIEQSRTAGGTLKPAEDVPGLGRAALWSATGNGLQVFLDDTRYVAINVNSPTAGRDPKAIATTIAKELS